MRWLKRNGIYVDGSCEPRILGGIAAYGFVVYVDDNKLQKRLDGRYRNNNVAQYAALCSALEWLLSNRSKDKQISIMSDGQLLVDQMREHWKCHGGLYAPKLFEAFPLARNFSGIFIKWIPYEKNVEADKLSRAAYESYYRNRGIEAKYHDAQLRPAEMLLLAENYITDEAGFLDHKLATIIMCTKDESPRIRKI